MATGLEVFQHRFRLDNFQSKFQKDHMKQQLLDATAPLFQFQYTAFIESVIFNQWFLIGVTIISSFLLNAELPLFALKFKTWDLAANKIRYVFIAICILATLLLKFIAIPFIILLYILMSLIWKE